MVSRRQCERFCSSELELTAASGCDHQRTDYNVRAPLRIIEDVNTRGRNQTRHAKGALLEKTITVDCLNCNPISSCAADGTCACPEGVTGIECNIACETLNPTRVRVMERAPKVHWCSGLIQKVMWCVATVNRKIHMQQRCAHIMNLGRHIRCSTHTPLFRKKM